MIFAVSLIKGFAMAQAIIHQNLTMDSQVYTPVSPGLICCGLSGTGTDFFPSSLVLPVNISTPWLHTHMPYLGDGQWAHWCPQLRDIFSPHPHQQQ
jgi:hypothetical protein